MQAYYEDNKHMIVIGTTAFAAAGKGLMSHWLRENEGAVVVRMSDWLRQHLEEQGSEINRETMTTLSTQLREDLGMGVLALKTLELIKQKKMELAAEGASIEVVVIDGVRHPDEVAYFRSMFGKDFYLASIETDAALLPGRYLARAGVPADDQDKLREFEATMAMEKGHLGAYQNIPETQKLKDFTLANDGDTDEFFAQIELMMQVIRNQTLEGQVVDPETGYVTALQRLNMIEGVQQKYKNKERS